MRPARRTALLLPCLLSVLLVAVPLAQAQSAPTAAEAEAFMKAANERLMEVFVKAERANWVVSNFITDDTEAMAADAARERIAVTMELAAQATRFDKLELPADLARQMKLLKLSLTLPAPRDDAAQKEMTTIGARLEGLYGKGKYQGKDLAALSRTLAESRKYEELLEAWQGWRTISPPMRKDFERFVQLSNQGARDLGFADLGALWRSNYDMPPDDFAREMDRLWLQVRPLYDALHAHVRARLAEAYGNDKVPAEGSIPAHLLGNMWSQSWENVYPLVAPADPGADVDVTALLKARKVDEREMVRYGERFFTSLGFEPLPKTFWERSLFTKPADREVVCHPSAWNIDWKEDLRLKMCIEVGGEDFVTIHHELGHNFYQRAYNQLPFLYQQSANDGFHEAIGDTVALSVTPAYLVKVGLLDKAPTGSNALGFLMRKALDKVAFLPFGLLVDKWRWQVFAGEIPPANYNATWWELVKKYQGVAPAVARSEADFDPGAKYHVAANVPYTRYFIAAILQFQLQRAACREAGFQGPLHECSVYGDQKVGKKLADMLAMGQSKPWPEALHAMTGERQMDATAMIDYFEPLKDWLDQQNKGRKVGF